MEQHSNPEIKGYCSDQFLELRQTFEHNFVSEYEIGASVALYYQGKQVVSLWAGYTDLERETEWQENTLVNIFSCSKGILAIACQILIQRGLLNLNERLSGVVPAFLRDDKFDITISDVLCHRACIPAIKESLKDEDLYDWQKMVSAITNTPLYWPLASKQAYHAMTFGWLCGEIIQARSGQTLRQFIDSELVDTLGLQFSFGLEPDARAISSPILPPKDIPPSYLDAGDKGLANTIKNNPGSVTERAFTNPMSIMTGVNTEAWMQAIVPAANGFSNASSLAMLYGSLADKSDQRILSNEQVKSCSQTLSSSHDEVLQQHINFGPGFFLSAEENGLYFGKNGFGHPGAGGAITFADPDHQIGFAYLPNRMGQYTVLDPRADKLIQACYQCL